MSKTNKQIIIYTPKNGVVDVQVTIDDDTVWLSLNQIAALFNKNKSTISRHINAIYFDGELLKDTTVAKSATVQKEGNREVSRAIEYFNLDVIISVGYRVHSKEGVQFRIWATQKLKEHLIAGYSLNESRLRQLKKTIQLISKTSQVISENSENKGLIEILSQYTSALEILDNYDHQVIKEPSIKTEATIKIEYLEAKKAIEQLREKFGGSSLFGLEKDHSFKSSISVIDQTFDGKELYTSLEEKAANLLYLVVKNHSFTDGNKRIAAWLFVWYLDKNNALFRKDGTKKISNSTLVALTLMIAKSDPLEKDILVNIIIHLINSKS